MPNTSGTVGDEGRQAFPVWQSVVALSPIAAAIGYIMAYLHELGYCGAFGIPSGLIRLQSTMVITTAGRVFLSLFFLLWIAFFLLLYVNNPDRKPLKPIRRRLLIIAFILLSYTAFGLGYYRAFLEWYLALPLFLYFVLLLFLGPLWTRRDVKSGYIAKLAAQDEADRQTPYPIAFVTKHVGWASIGILFLVLLLLSLSYLSGENTAARQEYFLVPSTNENSVVLRVYGDQLICAELDEQSNRVSGRFFVLKLDDEPRPVLSVRKIGTLVGYRDD